MKKSLEAALRSSYYHDISFRDELAFQRVYNVVSGVLEKFAEEKGVNANKIKVIGVTNINVGGSEFDWVSENPLGKSVTTPALEMEVGVTVERGSFFSKSLDTHDVKVGEEDFEGSGVVVMEMKNLAEYKFLFM